LSGASTSDLRRLIQTKSPESAAVPPGCRAKQPSAVSLLWAEATASDCLIIGGGSVGMMAAVYLARLRRRVRVVDVGASLAAFSPKRRR
jgi:NADPH-dependent 2,4-dienoyl-CoA reductase/sulfur reductase-like enzyme